jgi:hypothetical protein
VTIKTDDLLFRLSGARYLDDAGRHGEALEEFRNILKLARRRGLPSPFLLGATARAAVDDGELETAVGLAEEALRLDPLHLPARQVLDSAAVMAGARLSNAGRDPSDPETPRLYRLLVRAGRTDARSALALASFHESRGQRGVADALRGAVRVMCRDFPPAEELPFTHGDSGEGALRGLSFPVPGIGKA